MMMMILIYDHDADDTGGGIPSWAHIPQKAGAALNMVMVKILSSTSLNDDDADDNYDSGGGCPLTYQLPL